MIEFTQPSHYLKFYNKFENEQITMSLYNWMWKIGPFVSPSHTDAALQPIVVRILLVFKHQTP